MTTPVGEWGSLLYSHNCEFYFSWAWVNPSCLLSLAPGVLDFQGADVSTCVTGVQVPTGPSDRTVRTVLLGLCCVSARSTVPEFKKTTDVFGLLLRWRVLLSHFITAVRNGQGLVLHWIPEQGENLEQSSNCTRLTAEFEHCNSVAAGEGTSNSVQIYLALPTYSQNTHDRGIEKPADVLAERRGKFSAL